VPPLIVMVVVLLILPIIGALFADLSRKQNRDVWNTLHNVTRILDLKMSLGMNELCIAELNIPLPDVPVIMDKFNLSRQEAEMLTGPSQPDRADLSEYTDLLGILNAVNRGEIARNCPNASVLLILGFDIWTTNPTDDVSVHRSRDE